MQISIETADLIGESGKREAVGLILLLNTVAPGALDAAYEYGDLGPAVTVDDTAAIAEDCRAAAAGFASAPASPPPTDSPSDPAAVFGALEPVPPTDPAAAFGAPLDGAVPAPPSEPAASPATPEPAKSGMGLDSRGFPWDPRIHSTSRDKAGTLKADGSWRAKAGVPADTVAAVEAEWRAKGYGQPAASPPASSAPPAGPAVPPSAPLPAAAPPAPPPPIIDGERNDAYVQTLAAPALAAPAALSVPQQFANLMRKITPAQTQGLLTVVDIAQICESAGVQNLRDLMSRGDLIPTVEAQVDALISAQTGA